VHEFGQIVKEELEPLQRYAAFIAKRRERLEKLEEAEEEKAKRQQQTGTLKKELGTPSSSTTSCSAAAVDAADNGDSRNDEGDEDEDDDSDFDGSDDDSSDTSDDSGSDDDDDDRGAADCDGTNDGSVTKKKVESKRKVNPEDGERAQADKDADGTDDDEEEEDSDEDDEEDDNNDDEGDDGFEEESNPALSDSEGGTEMVVVPEGERAMRSTNKRTPPTSADLAAATAKSEDVDGNAGAETDGGTASGGAFEPPAKRLAKEAPVAPSEQTPVSDLTALSPTPVL